MHYSDELDRKIIINVKQISIWKYTVVVYMMALFRRSIEGTEKIHDNFQYSGLIPQNSAPRSNRRSTTDVNFLLRKTLLISLIKERCQV